MAKYEPDLNLVFAALSDPTRRAIVARLARGSASVGEIAGNHDMALPTILAHVGKLEASGLVATEKKGRVRTCRLVPDAIEPAQGWLDQQRAVWQGRLDRFDDYVTTLMKDRADATGSRD